MKKTIILTFILALLFSILGTTECFAGQSSGKCGENLTWLYTFGGVNDGQLKIIGTGDMDDFSSNVTPWSKYTVKRIVIDDGVTSIGLNAFAGCNKVEKVTLSNTVLSIGDNAFNKCSLISAITIPASITIIGEGAFSECSELKTVTFQGTLNNIAPNTFYNCEQLKNISIPSDVTSIGDNAFYNCRSLSDITIPSSVRHIGKNAFRGCSYLWNMYITDLSAWCNISFDNELSNPLYHASLYIDNTLVKNLVIPDGVEAIKPYAFSGCDSLISVTIPDTVTTIDSTAFVNCEKITSIRTPYTFSFPKNIKSVTITKATKIQDEVLSGCDSLESVDLPSGLLEIGNNAFYNCSSLTNISIPKSVIKIGDNAFYNCSSLTNISIPKSVTEIGNNAFEECTSLQGVYITDLSAWCNINFANQTSNPLSKAQNLYLNGSSVWNLIIPDEIRTINPFTFYNCDNMTTITISNKVSNIASSAFENCDGVLEITTPYLFDKLPKSVRILNITNITTLPTQSLTGYTNLLEVNLPKTLTTIETKAFYNCRGISSINIPSTVTRIGNDAFYGCDNLTNVYITDLNSWCNIDFANAQANPLWSGGELYLNNTNLEVLVIPQNVTEIKNYAFYNCIGLREIIIPDTVGKIGNLAFYGCNNITNATLPFVFAGLPKSIKVLDLTNTTAIISNALSGYTNLQKISLPDNLTSIGYKAFYNCCNLSSVIIPDSVKSIDDYAFYGCSNLTIITIPDSVTSIGNYAFRNCVGLTTVNYNAMNCTATGIFAECTLFKTINIGEKVKNISASVFSDCTNLTNINVDNNNQYYSADVNGILYDKNKTVLICYPARASLTNITIPDDVTGIGEWAFSACKSLTSITIPNSVTAIGDYAFWNCTNLKTVHFLGTLSDFEKISIGSGNSYFQNTEIIYMFHVKILDLSGNVIYEKTQFGGEPIDLSDVIDNNAQYYLYYDNKKIGKYDIASPITSDLVLYADVFNPILESITITGRNSADLGETITKTVYFATDKDIKYISFDIRYPEELKYKVIPVDFMYVEEASSKTGNGFITLTLTCVYSNSGYAPKNKTIIPFELEFEIDNYAKVGENTIEILNTTKYGTGTLEPFTAINSTSIEINPKLAESITISGEDAISEITTYTATITPDYTTNKSIEWSVSDSSIATITQEGILKPIKNGQVKIYAQTIDGSNLIAEKVVNVSAKAKIESLTTSVGDWECAFNGDIREYVVYVPENCENISVSATYNGEGILKIGGRISITGTLLVQLENTTTTILVERVDAGADYIDGTYTLTVVKTKPFTQVTVSEDGKSFNVRAYLVGDGSKMLLALYKEKKFVKLYNDVTVQGKIIPFTVAEDYDTAKIMVWDNFSNCQPLCDVEEINVNE